MELADLCVPPETDIKPYLPEVAEEDRIRSCVVLGSFGKFHDQINQTIDVLEENGVCVLAPKRAPIVDGEGFQLLATDSVIMADLQKRYPQVPWSKEHFAAVIEKIFKKTIDVAGFVYIVNPNNVVALDGSMHPNGYAGTMAASEIGHAIAAGKPIYSLEPLDPALDEYDGVAWPVIWAGIAEMIKAYQPEHLVAMVDSGHLDVEDYFWCEGYQGRWRG